MTQTPVNYATTPVPVGYQPSYNAVKIDIHNPKVMDAPQMPTNNCNSAYGMPTVPYYNYPMVPMPWQYPYMPMPTPQPTPQVNTTPTAPKATETQNQPTQAGQTVAVPVPVVPQAPVQQIINNAVPPQQTIQQNVPQVPQPVPVVPVPVVPQAPVNNTPLQTVTPQQPVQQTVNNFVPQAPTVQTPVNNTPSQTVAPQTPTTVAPEQNIPTADVTVVLKGLKSNNMAEQADALSQIGYASQKPDEIKKYLETSVLDSLLDILKTDISGLATATPEQIEARTKMVNEKPITEEEKNLAQTYAPQEFAILNKQNALYSIAVIQKALADEIEKAGGKKLSIEELPAIDQVVDTVKSNPSPELRGSAIVALAHLNKPEYKPVLQEIFELAQKDQDPNVKDVATEALKKINE